MTKNRILSHAPEDTWIPASWAAVPTEKGLVMAVEKPKQAAMRHAPSPTMVSSSIDSINTMISGSKVASSSNMPKRLPKSMKTSTVMQTTALPRPWSRRMMLLMKVLTPPVFSSRLKTPLITSRKILIIIMVRASSDANTRTGAVRTRHRAMPSTCPCT